MLILNTCTLNTSTMYMNVHVYEAYRTHCKCTTYTITGYSSKKKKHNKFLIKVGVATALPAHYILLSSPNQYMCIPL